MRMRSRSHWLVTRKYMYLETLVKLDVFLWGSVRVLERRLVQFVLGKTAYVGLNVGGWLFVCER